MSTPRVANAAASWHHRAMHPGAHEFLRGLSRRYLAAALLLAGLWGGSALAAGALPILVYHQIRVTEDGPPDGETALSLEHFEAQMGHLSAEGYRALDMDEVMAFLRGAPFPEKVVAIHFDDGWKSARHAIPVLERYGLRASFWIIAGSGIGAPHMDWEEIVELDRRPAMEVYSHSMSHPWRDGETLVDWVDGRTPGKGEEDARRELAESRRLLEQKLGQPVPYLAWPRGMYNDTLVRLATEAGYTGLVTIDDGLNRPGGDSLRIKRTMVDGRCGEAWFRRVLADGLFRPCPAPGPE
jgi:peptidoglycan/xylan/chitin deacetylase (PgdA/CDA1 family)